MTSLITGFFEKNKNRIVGVTFILTFCMFCFFSLMDLNKRVSDYHFFAQKINGIIQDIHDSEANYTNLRITNFINSLVDEHQVAALILSKDKIAIKAALGHVYSDFRYRSVPVASIAVVDLGGELLFNQVDPVFPPHDHRLESISLREAFSTGKKVYGFETGTGPLHYDIAIPIISPDSQKVVGAVEIAIHPDWFHFRVGGALGNARTAIIANGGLVNDDQGFSSVFEPYQAIFAHEKRKSDVAFFEMIADRLDLSQDLIEQKIGGEHYLISTSQKLRNPLGEQVGVLLVAYDMTDFRNRQWGYFYLWVLFFACTSLVMFLISYFGFRKYDQIISAQGKKLAHRSKQCALGEMLSYIGHQWRQPLNALSLTIQNIELQSQLGKLDDALVKKQVGAANKNIQYLTTIIEDWRSLLTSGTTRQLIELSDSVSRAIGIVHPVLERDRIFIANRINGPVHTHGFVNDLVQLTVNVLLNAKDALINREEERLILLSTHQKNGLVVVEFQDNGGGIPPKLLNKVFEPYLTTKEDSAGTGLGLYLCRQIAENLDQGAVWAENREFEFEGKRYHGACICLKFKATSEENSCES